MAARSSLHHHQPSSSMVSTPRFGTRKAALRFRASHVCNSPHLSAISSTQLSFAATANKKVFEDQLRGIVCYRDDKGELVCEGYDEGPRLGMRLPEKACFPWPVGVQITDFIELATFRVFEDADVLQLKNDQKRQI
ncbi:hypothetical protein E2562_011852 [Oryza meyeriana var. granulata]|uniref:Uncharacterized protein n=1 Tax=Oryza meyeriana var. granulata TaxID=110450 RepID=A0A6G1CPP2_9ORYZ|nr:hypothetical protein E2562_011852 [Oryza meyeriana var. granulata]